MGSSSGTSVSDAGSDGGAEDGASPGDSGADVDSAPPGDAGPEAGDGGSEAGDGGAEACTAHASLNALCGGGKPPHFYRCIVPYVPPAACQILFIGNAIDTYCCP
jgi:hypothetical protein